MPFSFPILFAFVALIVASCSPLHESRNRTLVIVVDGVNFQNFSCPGIQPEKLSLSKFCSESVKFTHVFTPSTHALGNYTALLTGKGPMETEVVSFDNYLPEYERTFTETYLEAGVRTGLVSGGAPIFRKTGLDQGFEYFDDNIPLSTKKIFRPAKKVVSLAKKWLSSVGARRGFFLNLYLVDPRFGGHSTTDNDGQLRPKGRNSQILEVWTQISELFDYLIKNDLWTGTTIVLTSSSGVSSLVDTTKFTNFSAENTHVPYMLKKSDSFKGKVSDLKNKYFSLDKVSKLVFENNILDREGDKIPSYDRENESRKSVFMVTSWLSRSKKLKSKVALKKEQHLFVLGSHFRVFEDELNPSMKPFGLEKLDNFRYNFEEYIKENSAEGLNLSSVEGLDVEIFNFINTYLIEENVLSIEKEEEIILKGKDSRIFQKYLLLWGLKNKNWTFIKKIAENGVENDWLWLVSQRKNYKVKPSGCISYVEEKNETLFYKNCKDSLSLAFWNWHNSKFGKSKKFILFRNLYLFYKKQQRVQLSNLSSGLESPRGLATKVKIHWLEILLSSKKYKDIDRLLQN